MISDEELAEWEAGYGDVAVHGHGVADCVQKLIAEVRALRYVRVTFAGLKDGEIVTWHPQRGEDGELVVEVDLSLLKR